MRYETFRLQAKGSQPSARLCVYILDASAEIGITKRPLILICPGGGYVFTSDREAEPLAMRFLAMGYHAAVLRYSVSPSVFPTALCEAAKAMELIHARAEEWLVDTSCIVLQGSSAGGHLAASLGVFWNREWLFEKAGVSPAVMRPAAMLLCYPVITSGEYAHRDSFKALLKGVCTPDMLTLNSLEKQVSSDTPGAFLWHTGTDGCVPVQNSLLFVEALTRRNRPVEFHLYPTGGHGLSTCDRQTAYPDGSGIQEECQSWLPLAKTYLEGIEKTSSQNGAKKC